MSKTTALATRAGRLCRGTACLLVAAALAAGCQREGRTLVHQYRALPQASWSAFDTLHFELPPAPQTTDYVFSLGLRLRNTFPYEEIWMVTEMEMEKPSVVLRDTLRYLTIHPDGSPRGRGMALQQDEQPLCTLQLFRGQHGRLRLYHIMSREVMPDVANIGFKVERLKEGRITDEIVNRKSSKQ